MKPRFLLTAFVIAVIPLLSVSAQGLPAAAGGISLTPSTPSPQPGQTVTITAESYSMNINAATLTWTSGGRTIAKGVGVTSVSVKAPSAGKTLTVSVSAVSADGLEFKSDITLYAGAIDLVVEPQGYVPPMFSGKAPVAYQNAVRITAMPHLANSAGVEYDPRTLVYKWEQGSNVLQSQSGYGRQSVMIPGSIIPRPYQILVTVSTRDGSAESQTVANVVPGSPSLFFYRNDPTYGPLYNRAVTGTISLGSSREASILAVPFGFDAPSSGTGDLSFKWFINDFLRPELGKSRSIVIRAPEGQAGASAIRLDISNANQILQSAHGSFTATFDASAAATSTIF